MTENKGDLISREALRVDIERIKQNVEKWVSHTKDDTTKALVRISLYEEFIDLIDNAPTVTPDYDTGYQDGLEDGLNDIRPKGEWIEIPVQRDLLYNTGIKYTCSNCGRGNCYGKPPFCMYCGADMRGGEEE